MQVKATIQGVVQGVGFRPFVYRLASQLDLGGHVKNTSGGVEIVLNGDESEIKTFFDRLTRDLPPLAGISNILVEESKFGEFGTFKIFESSRQLKPLISIPPDVATCEDCLRELCDDRNRRYNYWFITCTNCGPRFTITEEIPYDRILTTMKLFEMCKDCEKEYTDPLDRRYHAQTVACHKCGPRLELFDNVRRRINADDPILKASELLSQGSVVAIKGIGGIHLACLTSDDDTIKELRTRRRKMEKPFAIMARDLNMVRSFAEVNPAEEILLKSWQRPIVLLKKSENYWLSEHLSPKLHNIGVMLPYTALHHLLFNHIDEPLVMTSANLPDEPTIKDEDEAFDRLSKIADYFLMHNRRIHQRSDDSVIRVINDKPIFLRRSRGYVLTPIEIDVDFDGSILALGAELDNSFCIYKDGKAYLSQYIGDTSNYDTFCDLKGNLEKFQKLLGVKRFDVIACDLHPQFNTTKLAEELARKHDCKLIRIQHHFAHLASCMAEHGLEEAVGMVCDGYGYGLDGKAWGGEIVLAKQGKFERVGHLEYHSLIGGDLATKYPLRIVVGILSGFMKEGEIKKIIGPRVSGKEVEIWLRQLDQKFNVVESSSCGRFLDAVSALFSVSDKRDYEGEPAIKLESFASRGRNILDLPVSITKIDGAHVLNTRYIFEALVENLENNPEDLALSVHRTLALGSVEIVKKFETENVCFTGGVAHNELFNRFLMGEIPDLSIQTKVPCGDGGISLGQVYINKFLDTIHP